MFILRLFSFVVFLSIFFLAIFIKGNIGLICFGVLCIFLAYNAIMEFCKMLSGPETGNYLRAAPIFGTLAVIYALTRDGSCFSDICLMMGLFAAACWVCLLFSSLDRRESLNKIVNSVVSVFMIVFPLIFLVTLYKDSRYLFLYLVLVTKVGDTGAYISGTLSNKILKGRNHKIVPSISPKKSWEGTIGGLVMSIILSIVLWNLLPLKPMPYYFLIISGFILFWGGFAGDLAESALKRICGVKDSGKIVPGMGGTLDVVDSLLLNAPLFYFFISVIF